MAVFITPVNVTPGTAGSFQDVDCSASIPAGATGVILHVVADGAQSRDIGLRKNGSTDNRTISMVASSQFWGMVGVDGSRIFEAHIENIAMTIWLVGYTTADAVFFTNAVDKTPAGTTGWQDVDISADTGADTATGAILEATVSTATPVNFRKNGSTDNRSGQNLASHIWAVTGVDASEICETYRSSANYSFCGLVGYVKSDWTFNTNGIDVSLTATAAWTDITLSAGAIGGVIETYGTATNNYGLRKNGSAEDIQATGVNRYAQGIVECDGSRLIEGIIAATTRDFFEIGIATAMAVAAGGSPFLRRDHPALFSQLRR